MPYPSILDQRKVEIAAICRRHKVAELALFGSAATGDLRSNAISTFLLSLRPALPIGLLGIWRVAGRTGSCSSTKGFDLVSKRGLKPSLRESVLQQAQPVYAG